MEAMDSDAIRDVAKVATASSSASDHYDTNTIISVSSRSAGENAPINDEGGTFIVNTNATTNNDSNNSSDSTARHRGFPIPPSEINHMFSPLPIELMFQRTPSSGANSDTRGSASITGLLWRDGNRGSSEDGGVSGNTMSEQGNTLKMLLKNGSNPQQQQQQQADGFVMDNATDNAQQQQQHIRQTMPIVGDSALMTPSSPPETVSSLLSMQQQQQQQQVPGYLQTATATTQTIANVPYSQPQADTSQPVPVHAYSANGLPLLTLGNINRHGMLKENQRLPPIPSSPHLRPSSKISVSSIASSTTSMQRKPLPDKPIVHFNAGNASELTFGGSSSMSGSGAGPSSMLPPQAPHISRKSTGVVDWRLANRSAPAYEPNEHSQMAANSYVAGGQPLQQQLKPRPFQPAVQLRQEVLDKAARRSQPATPSDPSSPFPSSGNIRRPTSMMQRCPPPAGSYPTDNQHSAFDDSTVIPGGGNISSASRPRAQTWNSMDEGQQGQQQSLPRIQHRAQHSVHARQRQLPFIHQAMSNSQIGAGINRPVSATVFGGAKMPDGTANVHGRKASDGSAQLLTPKDFDQPLPNRIGDMVLDKEIGEWVHIADYGQSSAAGSPFTRSPISTHAELQTAGANVSSSVRSSISARSHASAFPQPLPTERDDSHGLLASDAGHQNNRVVREMVERKSMRGDNGTVRSISRATNEDEALGSIVHRLMAPTASVEGAMELSLSGTGIRNLEGLSQTTSQLESIYLDRNKLRSLSGLPSTIVNLTASSNWIRFSASDKSKFVFARELPHLENVDLSSNEISDISVFSGLPHLRVLILSRNRIDSLRGLRGCRRLALLRLRDNYVADFDLDADEVPLLNTIDLYNNRLEVLPANVSAFGQLASVNLVKNDLGRVELQWPPAYSIRELKLSENPHILRRSGGVVDVREWAAKFPNLKTLYLDTCSIKHLAQSAGSSNACSTANHAGSAPGTWPSLFNISLRGNAARPELMIDFGCLPNAKNVYAPDTRLLLPHTLPTMRHVKQLVLCSAGLRYLPSNMAEAMPHLEQLDICGNPDLADLGPLPKLVSLVGLLCRDVGFGRPQNLQAAADAMGQQAPMASRQPVPSSGGGLEAFPELNNALAETLMASADNAVVGELRLLQGLKSLRHLKVLDLRFNQVTADLYAPASIPALAAASDAVHSPQSSSSQSMFSDPSAMAAAGWRSRSNTATQGPHGGGGGSSGSSSTRIDETAWRKQDAAYWAHLNQTRQPDIAYRRMHYRKAAKSLFPQLEALDGIKCDDH
ncbi:Leucine-rich repeat protein [Dipsacomyces acuminosporus]|nr:Leucine-rich repeat protein [Dipsacomyces acuminosporus]